MNPRSVTTFMVQVSDNRKINVRRMGCGPEVLLLVHGFGENSYAWGDVSEDITSSFTVFAVDLQGHGDSDWNPQGRYSIEGFASDLTAVINYMDIDSLSVIGHSMGADVALCLTSMLSKQVAKLVLAEFSLTTLSGEVRDFFLAQFNAQFRRYQSVSEFTVLLQQQRPLADEVALLQYSSNAIRPTHRCDYEMKCDPKVQGIYQGDEQSLLAQQRIAIAKLSCPLLLVRGSGSAIVTASAMRDIAITARYAKMQSVHGAGHAVMLDRPKEFYDVISSFLLPHNAQRATFTLHRQHSKYPSNT